MDEKILENEIGVTDDFEADVIYRRDKRGVISKITIPDDIEEVNDNAGND